MAGAIAATVALVAGLAPSGAVDALSTGFTSITWSTAAPSPIRRTEAQGVSVDGRLFVFGGYFDSTFVPTKRSDVYEPSGNKWSRLPDMPRPITHGGIVAVGRDIYVAGGYAGKEGGGQVFAIADVYRYNIDSATWFSMPSLPVARGSGALVLLGRNLHFFGGVSVTRADRGEHFVLSLDGGGWTRAASLPNPRSHLGGAVLDGKIYAVGGQHKSDAAMVAQSSVHVWDPSRPGSWTSAASLPKVRSHISSSTFVMGGRIIVIGGEVAHNRRVADVTAYDPTSKSWRALTALPQGRSSGVAGAISNQIFHTTGSLTATTYKGVPG